MNCHRGPQSRSRGMKIVQGQDDLVKRVTSRFAYGSFRLLSVRLRPICQFAYEQMHLTSTLPKHRLQFGNFNANPNQAQGLPFPSLLTGVLRRRTQIYKCLRPFSSEQRDREAWGEFTNPRENDPNKMAEGRKENTNRTYLLSIFTAKEGPMCD